MLIKVELDLEVENDADVDRVITMLKSALRPVFSNPLFRASAKLVKSSKIRVREERPW